MSLDNSDPFIHLKTHTEYSIVDGIVRIDDLIERAKKLAMPAVAMTDFVNLFGAVKFYKAALAAGIKPIIGSDLILIEGDHTYSFTLLCLNQQGYRNLTQLITRAYREGLVQGRPLIKREWLEEHHEGLLALSGGKEGDVGRALLAGDKKQAETFLQHWLQWFPNRYYLELKRTFRDNEENYLHAAVELAQQFNVPVVATNDVCFLDQDDFEAHEARVCIHAGYTLEDSNRPHLYSEYQYFRDNAEMTELFADIPEAIQNSFEIAKRCNLQLSLGQVFLPKFPVPPGKTIEDFFEEQAVAGLKNRFPNSHPSISEYDARLQFELKVINQMGFAGYFLIVADFIRWAKEQGIAVGPGRGSGAGSLVAYVLGITELDPLLHELLFERFLNPERVSMPDFDVDFCMERRDQVIEYVVERYGRHAVSQIITYGTMAAKAVVRDVGRVLGYPYGFVDKVAKLIPFELGMTLEKAMKQEPLLAERCQKEEEVQTLMHLAMKLEGVVRNAGKHAGGVVIAPGDLTDFTPLYFESEGDHPVTQFDKDDIETIGLVKFDFLGLRTLTIIDWALQAINKRNLQKNIAAIDILHIPLDDKKTFELLQSCATTAVFQLESRGMKDLIRRLKPDCFDEIVALVALFRPGPLQSGMVDDFINRKHRLAAVDYLHPKLESILRPTYGVILYQEQVMQIAQILAGYSLGGADILRKAMGKKKPEEMAKQRQIFTEGAKAGGVEVELAESIFDLMEKFAGYGFNKSHSAAYALISYQTAWLKTHYPAEFMAAVLSSDMDNTDKVVGFLEECTRMQLKILPPNINNSFYQFTVNQQNQIEYGLGAIKGVGQGVVDNLVVEREQNGPYKDIFDVCRRLDIQKLNRRALEPLIRSGAMDCFKKNRATLMETLEKAIQSAEQQIRNANVGQGDLFAIDAAANNASSENNFYVETKAWDEFTRLQGEKEVLGWYISGHPLQAIQHELSQLISSSIYNLSHHPQKTATIAGLITSQRIIQTRTGKRLVILQVEDATGRMDISLFGELFEEVRRTIEKDSVVVVNGKVEKDEFSGGMRMRAETIEPLDQVRLRKSKKMQIQLLNVNEVEHLIKELPQIVRGGFAGHCPLSLLYKVDDKEVELQLSKEWSVKVCDALLQRLKTILGNNQIVIQY